MIESITIQNFQIHRSLHVDLEDITVLAGDNDTGKSTVLRALLWLALNQWDGKAGEQVSWGEKFCKVGVVLEDHWIGREQSQDSNSYILDGQELRAIRTGVPQIVADILKMGPDSFQNQHDPPFWLLLSSGQAAQALNEIFNLSAIDTALANVASELRQARAKASAADERLIEAKRTWKELEWTKQADRDLKALEQISVDIQSKEKEIISLSEVLQEMSSLSAQKKKLENISQKSQSILSLGERIIQIDLEITRVEEILELEKTTCRLEKELVELESSLANWLKGTCPLCGRR